MVGVIDVGRDLVVGVIVVGRGCSLGGKRGMSGDLYFVAGVF